MDNMEKVIKSLSVSEYQTAQQLAEKCGCNKYSIYRMIRTMRLKNVGVLTTNKGYVLAEFATTTDDVNYFRRIQGRRVSDYISVKAAEPHITRRWKGIEQRKDLKSIVKPFNKNELKIGMIAIIKNSDLKSQKRMKRMLALI